MELTMHRTMLIKALEDGVSVIFSNSDGSGPRPPERLDEGEVLILSAPENFEVYHVRGKAEIYSPEHKITAESSVVIGGKSEK
jgi:hypothetical protein